MPQFICLVQRCNLADGRLIRENEIFEVSEEEAANLGARIAKPVEKPVAARKPEPMKESIPAKVAEKQPDPKEPINDRSMQTETQEVKPPESEEKIFSKKRKRGSG